MAHTVHPRFDLAGFSKLFSLADLKERAREHVFLAPAGQIITSPFHLTVTELIRREALGEALPVGAEPADVFVFGAGEPAAPYLTKVGGAPFRSRHKVWPTTDSGRLLGFVGQLSFVDSMDLVGSVPGEVLLIFADPENLLSEPAYLLEWVTLDETDILSMSEVPAVTYAWKPGRVAQRKGALPEKRPFAPFVCHGVIHRTFDLPGSEPQFVAYAQPSRLAILEGTKIAGVPHWTQSPQTMVGRFLAALGSIQPASEVVYPWVNQPAPLSRSARHAIPTWKYSDMGTLNVFENQGRAVLSAQSY